MSGMKIYFYRFRIY